MNRLGWWRTACAVGVLCAAASVIARGQTLTTVVNFNGIDGAAPTLMSLVQGLDGSLYGTTAEGGQHDSGTVFKVGPSEGLTTLYKFCSQKYCTDGAAPYAGLLLATDGNFYGTTYAGGPTDTGTIFKITAAGVLTTLHTFNGYAELAAGLIQGTDGNLYGTTEYGGAHPCGNEGTGCGSVFRITPDGAFTTLHSFDATDGNYPIAALVQGTDGNFYGTTEFGGAHDSGTVFKMTPTGTLVTLYNFCAQGSNCPDGAQPSAALVQATDGSFYGSTYDGGANNEGVIFKINSGGRLTIIHNFDGADGALPSAPLVQATDGNLYGTTVFGGASDTCTSGCGTIFRIAPDGTFASLHSFDSTDGSYVSDGLFQATSGTFYGATLDGGADHRGTLFSEASGLGPFVTTLPAARKVGQSVIILGNNLKGSTSVTFNGTPAVFTVVSETEIATTVPYGATSGTVQVVTPGGTLSSNAPFRVIQ